MTLEVQPQQMTYNRWTLIERLRAGIWRARCACGTVAEVRLAKLRSGWSKSCGCLQAELSRQRLTTHGHSAKGVISREMKIWCGMIDRCHREGNPKYPRYGGRGIKVCDRWRGETGFQNFISDMGTCPSPQHSIDRYPNNDGDYEPGNCRWATGTQQQRNKSTNRIVSLFGFELPAVVWEEGLGLRKQILTQRLDLGWSDERALLEPITPMTRGVKAAILAWLTENPGLHTAEEIRRNAPDCPSKTVTSLLGALVSEGRVTRPSRGIYERKRI